LSFLAFFPFQCALATVGDVYYADENGAVKMMPSNWDDWFDNAASKGVRLLPSTIIHMEPAMDEMTYALDENSALVCMFAVDGTEYPIQIGQGKRIVVEKTEEGRYLLLPDDTIALEPIPADELEDEIEAIENVGTEDAATDGAAAEDTPPEDASTENVAIEDEIIDDTAIRVVSSELGRVSAGALSMIPLEGPMMFKHNNITDSSCQMQYAPDNLMYYTLTYGIEKPGMYQTKLVLTGPDGAIERENILPFGEAQGENRFEAVMLAAGGAKGNTLRNSTSMRSCVPRRPSQIEPKSLTVRKRMISLLRISNPAG